MDTTNTNIKYFELRDAMTFIPVVCIRVAPRELSGVEAYLAQRAGIAPTQEFVYMLELTNDRIFWNPSRWGDDRDTRFICHMHILHHWEELSSGDVIDAEYILGLQPFPRTPERLGEPHIMNLEDLKAINNADRKAIEELERSSDGEGRVQDS